MKRYASIEIYFDGNHPRVIKSGDHRDISVAIEKAAQIDQYLRAACIVAVVGMFEKKNPDLAAAILLGLDIEPPSQAGKKAQMEQIKKVLAA